MSLFLIRGVLYKRQEGVRALEAFAEFSRQRGKRGIGAGHERIRFLKGLRTLAEIAVDLPAQGVLSFEGNEAGL